MIVFQIKSLVCYYQYSKNAFKLVINHIRVNIQKGFVSAGHLLNT